MKLLVVSHTAHYERASSVVAWGPTVRELDELSRLFDRVAHVAPLHAGRAPESAIGYASEGVTFVPVARSGGERLRDKAGILLRAPGYVGVLLRELRTSDVVHVRCPASLSLVAVLLLGVVRRPRLRWIKYAGNWSPSAPDAVGYRVTRWCLRRRFHRSHVTVNGAWPDEPAHVRAFLNPCLTDDELAEGERVGRAREMTAPVRALFVGRLEDAKGVGRAIRVLARLREAGVAATLDLVGDGPDRARYERDAAAAGLAEATTFHGWLPRAEIGALYASAHVLLLPSASEGWPKVLSEGMAYGVVPIASDVSGVRALLERAGAGSVADVDDVDGYAAAIAGYAADPARWKRESERAIAAARRFGYGEYLEAVAGMLDLARPGARVG